MRGLSVKIIPTIIISITSIIFSPDEDIISTKETGATAISDSLSTSGTGVC